MPFGEWLPGLARFVAEMHLHRGKGALLAPHLAKSRRRAASGEDVPPSQLILDRCGNKAVRGAVVFAPGRDPKQSAQKRHVLSGGRWIMQPLGRVSLVRSAGSVM